MSKIVIAGAGIGGLVLAKELEEKGHEVVILEKNTLAALSFDWYDDVECGIVPEFNIDLTKIKHYPKQDWAFLFPEVEEIIGLTIPDEKKDISIHRRDLSAWLIGELKEAEMFFFLTKIVKGVGKKFASELLEKYSENELIEILNDRPNELLNFKGIKDKKLETIVASWHKFKHLRELGSFLGKFVEPLKAICSRKWARPRWLSSSWIDPTFCAI